jgi:hypothetical protein
MHPRADVPHIITVYYTGWPHNIKFFTGKMRTLLLRKGYVATEEVLQVRPQPKLSTSI